MKTKKNFLKKLTAGILGFVMTLGVGAAGYAASASEAKATEHSVEINRSCFPSGSLAYNKTDNWTATGTDGTSISGEGDLYSSASQTTMQSKNSGVSTMYHNTTAMPGPITKIELKCASGSTRTYTAYMNKTTAITSTSGGTSKGTIAPTAGNSASLTLQASDGWKYFWLNLAGGASFLDYIKVYYDVAPAGFSITYNANKPSGASGDVTGMPTTNPETGKTTFTKPSTDPSLSGYTFDGWYNATTGGTKYNGGETLSGNLSLYAHWNINKELDHVELGGSLSKTSYAYGDSWSSDGLTLTAYYTDTTSTTVTGSYSFSPATPTVGTTSVSITGSYGGETDTKSYTVTVNKATLSTPEPTFSAADKKITWPAVSNASSYQVKIGSGSYATASSPYDVSSYEGQGSKDFYVKAIGNSNYADSAEAHISFEVKASVKYKLVTSTDDLVAGCNYVIGSKSSGTAVFMSTTDYANNRRITDEITITTSGNDKIVTATDEMLNLELGGSSGAWTFKTTNYQGTNGYLASAASGSSNYCRVLSTVTTGTVSFSNDAVVINLNPHTSRTLLSYNSSASCFACYSSGQAAVYLFKEVVTTPSAILSATSLENYKDLEHRNTDITISCTNFDPTGLSFAYADGGDAASTHTATSQNVEISYSTPVSGVYTLSILCKKVGTTNVKIDVGGATLDSLYLDVTVKAKPGSITSNGFSKTEINFINKDSTSDSGSRLITPKLLDTDGNEMTSTPAKDLFTFTVSDPTKHIEVNESGRVYGDGNASATATSIIVASVELPTVTAEFPVQAIADYITGSWSVAGSLTKTAYNAGEEFNPADLAITAKYFFAGIQTVPYSELLFTTNEQGTGKANPYSFNNDDALGENATTIYIFYGDTKIGSVGNITVTPSDVPMTGLAFKLTEEGEEVEETDMIRGEELTLIPVFKPSNTTDSRTLEWDVEQDGSGISVDSTGKITVAADATVGNIGIITASTTFEDKDQITAEFMVTVLREEQKVHVIAEAEESWQRVTEDQDDWSGTYVIGYDNSATTSRVFTGVDAANDYKAGAVDSDGTLTYDSDMAMLEITQTGEGDDATFNVKILNGEKAGNYITGTDGSNTIKYSEDASTVNYCYYSNNGYFVLGTAQTSFTYNNNTNNDRFRFYKDGTVEGNPDHYLYPQAYKKSGGRTEYDATVSDDLFEAVVDASQYLNDDWELVELALSNIIDAGGEDLTILQHGVNLSTGNEVQKFLYNYDNLVVNSGEEDFLNRFVKHTVTFDSNGGSTVSPVTVVEGGKVTKPEDPTKTGYEFDKWYYENDEFDFNTPIMADITLTANWSEKSYNVSFSGSNVTFTGDTTCKYGASYSATLSASTGYSLPSSLTVTAGGSPFSGYSYNSSTGAFSITSMPADDISISGNATTVNYTISYNLDGGTALGTNPTKYTIESETITLFGASKTGCRFDGWYDSNNVKVTQIVKGSTGNISLTAKYIAETYNVSFTGEHVSSNGAATCEFGKPYSAIFTAEDSYILPSSITVKLNGEDYLDYDYSNVDGSFYIASMPAGNISISVTAQQGAYQITYKEVDGTVITEPQLVKEYEFGIGATLVDAQDRTGYKFVGWYGEPELVNLVESIAPTEKGNKIFYAKWAFAAQDALDSVQTSIGMSYTYQKDANAPIVSSSTPPTKVETRGTATYHYEKITSTDDLENNTKYLIVYETGNVALNGNLAEIDVVSDTVAVTISSGQIASSTDIDNAAFTYNNGSFLGTNGKYIYHTGSKNSLNTSSTVQTNTVSFDDDGNAVIACDAYTLRYNNTSGQTRFRYYTSGQQSVQLYKQVSDQKAVTSIEIVGTPSKTTYNVGEAYSAAGLSVRATYEGGSQEIVTATITPSKQYAAEGDTSVTFSATYEEKTASLPVNVTVNSVYSNVSFKFNFKNTGMDALVSEYGDVYDDMGLVVEYDGRTRYFSFIPDQYGNYYIYEDGKEATTYKMKDGGMFTLSLGDMINDTNGRADITFTVRAYIRAGETYYYSENSASYSVKSWIEYYHSKSEYKDATEDLYNIFFPNGK